MTKLAPLARQRRAAAIASLASRDAGNVIRVCFGRSSHSPDSPAFNPDQGMRPAAFSFTRAQSTLQLAA